eukprot:15445296-Heterocapsa_arctica.AAC.1
MGARGGRARARSGTGGRPRPGIKFVQGSAGEQGAREVAFIHPASTSRRAIDEDCGHGPSSESIAERAA